MTMAAIAPPALTPATRRGFIFSAGAALSQNPTCQRHLLPPPEKTILLKLLILLPFAAFYIFKKCLSRLAAESSGN